MAADEIKACIIETLPRDLLIDLLDTAVARARQAHALIRDNTDLTGRSARGLEGQARFRLMEKGFQKTCERHGGMPLEGDVIPGTDQRYYQPFMRFGGDHPGVLLGLASMPEPRELPTKNRSRGAGVTLNYHLTPRLDLEGNSRTVKPGDIFVLLLFARDPSQGGAPSGSRDRRHRCRVSGFPHVRVGRNVHGGICSAFHRNGTDARESASARYAEKDA